jgi:anti-anti-sigma factor
MGAILVNLQPRDPPVGVVALVGEHDAASSPRLANELALLLDEGIAIVVDLRETTFVDSQTLSTLLAARHDAEEAALGFVLVLPDSDAGQVHRLLDLTGLEATFGSRTTVEAAVDAARAGESGAGRVGTR